MLLFTHRSFNMLRMIAQITSSIWRRNLSKCNKQCLKIINDNFKTMSTQILEIEIYVKFIQLHLTHLQIRFKQRMKKKQHDAFIFNFCNRIKNRLTIQRDKRKRQIVKTLNEKKQKWSAKLAKKMRKKKQNERRIDQKDVT